MSESERPVSVRVQCIVKEQAEYRGVERVHVLKTLPVYFEAAWIGRKRAEVRRFDRNFLVGDVLDLRELEVDRYGVAVLPHAYTGRRLEVVVTHILSGEFGIGDDLAVLSFEVLRRIGGQS